MSFWNHNSEDKLKHHGYIKATIPQSGYFKLRFTLSYRDAMELLDNSRFS
jgi:hypothetical protein